MVSAIVLSGGCSSSTDGTTAGPTSSRDTVVVTTVELPDVGSTSTSGLDEPVEQDGVDHATTVDPSTSATASADVVARCTGITLEGVTAISSDESDGRRLLIKAPPPSTSDQQGCSVGPEVLEVEVDVDDAWITLATAAPPYTFVPAGLPSATSANFVVAIWFDECDDDAPGSGTIDGLRIRLTNDVTIEVLQLDPAGSPPAARSMCLAGDDVRVTDVFTFMGYG